MDNSSAALFVIAAIAGTYAWRFAGVLVAGRIEEGSPFFIWVSCVAYAIAAGLMMKLLIFPGGALADSTLTDRMIAFSLAVVVFFAFKRKLVPALATGVVFFFFLLWFRATI